MKQIFCLFIAAVFLFGPVVVHGEDVATLANINCGSVTAISFNIAIPDFDQWDADDADDWALNGKSDASCKPTFNQGSGLVEYAPFSVENCADAPTESVDKTKLEYTFSINVPATADSGPPIVYAYDHQYTVKCLYNREKDDLMASFEPRHSLTADASGNGQLVITLTLHYASDDAELSGVIDLNTPIYGKALVEADDFPNLDIHFQSVSASKDDANSVTSITLVTDGCEDANGIVSNTECDANADDKFYLDAFRYEGQGSGDEVYFHATVIVCLASDGSSECKTECAVCTPPVLAPGRKRRETVKESLQTTYYVKAGPYRVVDSTNKETTAEKQQEATAFPSYAIAIVAVCGVLAIAIASAVVVIVLRRRRQNTTFAEGRDAGVTA